MQTITKRLLDIIISVAGLIILLPLIIFVAIRVYFSSKGPILYLQERVGYKGKKFTIKKFRSMYVDAETNGPRLSADNDERITPWGRTMRRWKLDELPQLWNVLVGEMSIVGPRPEREYYIRQLEMEQQPFDRLLQVKPGITSLGMVNYGYANSVSKMRERMKYDQLYVERRSLWLDMMIMFRTLKIIFTANKKFN
ncbi:MAG: sugar transferase [Chitinophagaceae bacterium]|nr:sugar transferase [Chitinophagaceae bacterium]